MAKKDPHILYSDEINPSYIIKFLMIFMWKEYILINYLLSWYDIFLRLSL